MNDNNGANKNNELTEEQIAQGLNVDDSMAGTQMLNEDDNLQQEDKRDQELAEAKDKFLRLAAEFDNYRRRTAKERIELLQTAGKDIIQSLLDVLDDTERATKVIESSNDINAIKEGVHLVFNKLRNTLQQKGLKVMDAQGVDFDADLHEAITEIPAPSAELQGKVVDVIMPGYYLNDKLIRHAKVIVGK